jgi:hypothetical protein
VLCGALVGGKDSVKRFLSNFADSFGKASCLAYALPVELEVEANFLTSGWRWDRPEIRIHLGKQMGEWIAAGQR